MPKPNRPDLNTPGLTSWGQWVHDHLVDSELEDGQSVTDYVDNVASRLWMPATTFMVQGGSPTLTRTGVTPVYLLRPDGTDILNAAVLLGFGWQTVDLYAWGFNPSATETGDIMIGHFRTDHTVGGDVASVTGGSTTPGAVTAGAHEEAQRIKMNGSPIAVTAHTPFGAQFRRTGTSGSDTLSAQWAFMGYEIVRAS